MYGGRKTRKKGERFFEKARERYGRESLKVQGVTLLILSVSVSFEKK